MFGDEQPNAQQGTRDLVGQELAHASLQTPGVTGYDTAKGLGALGLERRGWCRIRSRGVQFFFEGRILG
jgi:hypothetical protein